MPKRFNPATERLHLALPPHTRQQIQALILNLGCNARDVIILAVAQLWQQKIGDKEKFEMNEYMIDAPCGCPACDESIQQGHFACESSPLALLFWERSGEAWRAYDNGGWHWFVNGSLYRDYEAVGGFCLP